MKQLLALSLLFVLGCATPRGGTDIFGAPEVRTVTAGSVSPRGESVVAGATTYRYEEQPTLVEDVVGGGVGEAFPALQAAYLSEGLVPDGVDPESGIVSLSRVEWSGARNGERLSTLLDCGLSATGRPMAVAARIVATLAAQVKEAGPDSSRVTMRLGASAYPYENGSGAVRACVTTGELERAVVARMRVALAPGQPAADPPGGTPGVAPSVPVSYVAAEGGDLPFSEGEQLRVWLSPGERITGAFLQIRADTVVLDAGRRLPVALGQIQKIQVRRTRRAALVVSAVVGVAAGVTLATTTDLGIHGQHGAQGRMLNPGLGALAGGVAGILVANGTFGTYWMQVSVGAARAR